MLRYAALKLRFLGHVQQVRSRRKPRFALPDLYLSRFTVHKALENADSGLYTASCFGGASAFRVLLAFEPFLVRA